MINCWIREHCRDFATREVIITEVLVDQLDDGSFSTNDTCVDFFRLLVTSRKCRNIFNMDRRSQIQLGKEYSITQLQIEKNYCPCNKQDQKQAHPVAATVVTNCQTMKTNKCSGYLRLLMDKRDH